MKGAMIYAGFILAFIGIALIIVGAKSIDAPKQVLQPEQPDPQWLPMTEQAAHEIFAEVFGPMIFKDYDQYLPAGRTITYGMDVDSANGQVIIYEALVRLEWNNDTQKNNKASFVPVFKRFIRCSFNTTGSITPQQHFRGILQEYRDSLIKEMATDIGVSVERAFGEGWLERRIKDQGLDKFDKFEIFRQP